MPILDGIAGVSQTLDKMREYAETYKYYPAVRELALSLVRDLPQKDYLAEAEALRNFVKFRIRYTKDIADTEVIQTPLKTLEYGTGDCDDKATLLMSMLLSIGHFPVRFHAMGFRSNDISHVNVEDWINNQWVSLETTEPVGMGWVPPGIVERLYR